MGRVAVIGETVHVEGFALAGATVIATAGGPEKVALAQAAGADHVIEIPSTAELLTPILEIVPLQLLAYHIAVRRGCDVDQPRNLAKSVTVE